MIEVMSKGGFMEIRGVGGWGVVGGDVWLKVMKIGYGVGWEGEREVEGRVWEGLKKGDVEMGMC